MSTTVELLREILVKDYSVNPDSLTLETPLEALGIDSLGVAELLFTVEEGQGDARIGKIGNRR